jgi:CheY-like chemotaxis protein
MPLHSVLLVSDSRDEREMYAEAFRMYGFHTLQAETAEEAYRLTFELSPALVITDIPLTGSAGGIELTRRLKAGDGTSGIPVVILTGYLGVVEHDEAARRACDLLVAKPCLPDALLKMAGDLIDRRMAREAARH